MTLTNPDIGMIQLAAFIFIILLGFPIAFTLVAMGIFFGFYAMGPRIFDLLVTNTYDVMSNDVLTAVPLFLFMGYVVERSNILDRLFYSIQMAARRIPASLAVATLITCALFATATGIVGAVVTLMGLLAFPSMLKAGYDTKLAAGVVCAGGCLGIMIPPSVLLILYGATTSVSVVQLYAAAFIPGFMLASLYVVYVVARAMIDPALAPRPKELERHIPAGEVLWALATSFFPLAILILSVLGAILLGLATPSEAAAVGSAGSLVLAAAYRSLTFQRMKEAVYLTARTSAMVCYLFIGSWTFSSVFSYLGGHEVIEHWVLAAHVIIDILISFLTLDCIKLGLGFCMICIFHFQAFQLLLLKCNSRVSSLSSDSIKLNFARSVIRPFLLMIRLSLVKNLSHCSTEPVSNGLR